MEAFSEGEKKALAVQWTGREILRWQSQRAVGIEREREREKKEIHQPLSIPRH